MGILTRSAWQLLLLLFTLSLTACATTRIPIAPGTVPKVVSPSVEERRQGEQIKRGILSKIPLTTSPRYTRRVNYVVRRLLAATGSQDRWSVYVLKAPEWNAFTSQGNNIYIYTGLLDDLRDDEQLAAVVAHELAHNLARHIVPTTDEIVNQMLGQIAGAVVQNALSESSGQTANAGGAVASEFVQGFVWNPHSQKLELEADHIGMFLMADAGFNPAKALTVWEKQARQEEYSRSSFFRTHPPSVERLESLQRLLPQAQRRYIRRR